MSPCTCQPNHTKPPKRTRQAVDALPSRLVGAPLQVPSVVERGADLQGCPDLDQSQGGAQAAAGASRATAAHASSSPAPTRFQGCLSGMRRCSATYAPQPVRALLYCRSTAGVPSHPPCPLCTGLPSSYSYKGYCHSTAVLSNDSAYLALVWFVRPALHLSCTPQLPTCPSQRTLHWSGLYGAQVVQWGSVLRQGRAG